MLEINEGVGWAETLAKFFTCNQFSGTTQQRSQHLKWHFLQLQSMSLASQLSAAKVGFVFGEANHCGPGTVLHRWESTLPV